MQTNVSFFDLPKWARQKVWAFHGVFAIAIAVLVFVGPIWAIPVVLLPAIGALNGFRMVLGIEMARVGSVLLVPVVPLLPFGPGPALRECFLRKYAEVEKGRKVEKALQTLRTDRRLKLDGRFVLLCGVQEILSELEHQHAMYWYNSFLGEVMEFAKDVCESVRDYVTLLALATPAISEGGNVEALLTKLQVLRPFGQLDKKFSPRDYLLLEMRRVAAARDDLRALINHSNPDVSDVLEVCSRTIILLPPSFKE
jgi:hypothetical protein